MTALRNGLAALLALLLLFLVGRALAPSLTAYLPDRDAVSAVLGLFACLLVLLYKLLDAAMTALRFGRRPPAVSRFVSVLAGASVLALVYDAFATVTTRLVEQAVPLLKASPGTVATVGKVLLHLDLWRMAAVFLAALMAGSWIGRRHGRPGIGVVSAFALLAMAMALEAQALAGLTDVTAVVAALRAFAHAPSISTARTAFLPILCGVLAFGLLGAWLGGGSRSRRQADRRPLVLGA